MLEILNKMIHFRGGEIQQKGKGIGGFFRGLINMLRPVARSVGSNLARAATSNTAKDIAKTLGEQAIDSTLNMTKDYLNGNDMKHSFDRETGEFRKRGSEVIEQVQTKRRRRDQPMKKAPKKRSTLKLMRKYDASE
mgnify:CR=1 FL=1|jgi:hypothetical protein